MNWKPEAGTRITIVPLDGDNARIKTFEMPSFFTFHYVNAFESGERMLLPPSQQPPSTGAPLFSICTYTSTRSVTAVNGRPCSQRMAPS